MKLSTAAILALKGMSKEQRSVIAEACGVKLSTLYRWTVQNDSSLTTAVALKAISQLTGLPHEQLLEDSEIAA